MKERLARTSISVVRISGNRKHIPRMWIILAEKGICMAISGLTKQYSIRSVVRNWTWMCRMNQKNWNSETIFHRLFSVIQRIQIRVRLPREQLNQFQTGIEDNTMPKEAVDFWKIPEKKYPGQNGIQADKPSSKCFLCPILCWRDTFLKVTESWFFFLALHTIWLKTEEVGGRNRWRYQ